MTISTFYTILQRISCRFVVTIGKGLLGRGITFSSTSRADVYPLAATALYYRTSESFHQVGINQAVGRILGTAAKSVRRVVYTTAEICKSYLDFAHAQETYIQRIRDSDYDILADVLCIDPRSVNKKRKITPVKNTEDYFEYNSAKRARYLASFVARALAPLPSASSASSASSANILAPTGFPQKDALYNFIRAKFVSPVRFTTRDALDALIADGKLRQDVPSASKDNIVCVTYATDASLQGQIGKLLGGLTLCDATMLSRVGGRGSRIYCFT